MSATLDVRQIRNIATHDMLPGIEVYLLNVTPDVAAELLLLNAKGQRSVSRATMERYATDMATMDWFFNGAPLLISNDGQLLDGQHRLTAIVESGEPQILLIVRGIDPEAMATIDTGRKRSFADALRIDGYKNHSTMAAVITAMWFWAHGCYGIRGVARVANPVGQFSNPSNAQKKYWKDRIEKEYDITFDHAASFAMHAYGKRRGISATTWGTAWTILSGIDKDLREEFFYEILVEAKSPHSGYPIVALTNKLGNISKRDSFDRVLQLDALFRTYNAWAANEGLQTLTPPRPLRWDTLRVPTGYTEIDLKAGA